MKPRGPRGPGTHASVPDKDLSVPNPQPREGATTCVSDTMRPKHGRGLATAALEGGLLLGRARALYPYFAGS